MSFALPVQQGSIYNDKPMGPLAHTLAIRWVNLSDDGFREKIMEAMLMNGKIKHAVFDWSDIVSMSQSEFA